MPTDSHRNVTVTRTSAGRFTTVDVDVFTTRRAEPESFVVRVDGEKVRDEGGNRMDDPSVTFRLKFPEGGDAARALAPDAVRRSHDRLCTVSRAVELGTRVATRIES